MAVLGLVGEVSFEVFMEGTAVARVVVGASSGIQTGQKVDVSCDKGGSSASDCLLDGDVPSFVTVLRSGAPNAHFRMTGLSCPWTWQHSLGTTVRLTTRSFGICASSAFRVSVTRPPTARLRRRGSPIPRRCARWRQAIEQSGV